MNLGKLFEQLLETNDETKNAFTYDVVIYNQTLL